MNERLYPMTRRCRFCGTPLRTPDRVCAEHRDLLRLDSFTALEALLNTTGAAASSSLASAAPTGGNHA